MMMSSGVAHPLLPSDLQRLYVAEGYWEQKTLAEPCPKCGFNFPVAKETANSTVVFKDVMP